MNKGIKAIPTVYKGIEYKSKLEAVVAQVFDRVGLEYEYEPRIFINDAYANVSRGVHQYKPDFYLPECNTWVEVAGRWDKRHKKNAVVFERDMDTYGWSRRWFDYNCDDVMKQPHEVRGKNWKDAPRYVIIADDIDDTGLAAHDHMVFGTHCHSSVLEVHPRLIECPHCHTMFFWEKDDYCGCPRCDSWIGREMVESFNLDCRLNEKLLTAKYGEDWKTVIKELDEEGERARESYRPKWRRVQELVEKTRPEIDAIFFWTKVMKDDGKRILVAPSGPEDYNKGDMDAIATAVRQIFGSRQIVFGLEGEVVEDW